MKLYPVAIVLSFFAIGVGNAAGADSACTREFEPSSDGGKLLTQECCEKIEIPAAFEACLTRFGVEVKARKAGHNSASKDQRFYRCQISLGWKDAKKASWVADPANLAACAAERKSYEKECDPLFPKGVIHEFSRLGFCSGDFKKHSCAMGDTHWCKK